MHWILTEFWPNSDVKSSNGSVPRRSNPSTQVAPPPVPDPPAEAETEEQKKKRRRPKGNKDNSTAQQDQALEKLKNEKNAMSRRAAAPAAGRSC